ncbi:MAG TPA: hypothetical protein VFT98_22855, partial [Myxococcota bacterium]|nr:hypothetical protein [Myxococcota bacterium]
MFPAASVAATLSVLLPSVSGAELLKEFPGGSALPFSASAVIGLASLTVPITTVGVWLSWAPFAGAVIVTTGGVASRVTLRESLAAPYALVAPAESVFAPSVSGTVAMN